MKPHVARRIFSAVGSFLIVFGTTAESFSPIQPGAEVKSSAGTGVVISRGPSALFYNPANIITVQDFEFSGEVSVISAGLSYTHPKHESFSMSQIVPFPTAGFGLRHGNFATGLYFMPTGSGSATEIEEVPVDVIPGQDINADIVTTQSGFQIAGGAAYRFIPELTLGAGVVFHETQDSLSVTASDGSGLLLEQQKSGSGAKFTTGIRSEFMKRRYALGISFSPAAKIPFKGTETTAASAGVEQDLDKSLYLPMTIGLGGEARFGAFNLSLEYTFEQYSAGRKIGQTQTNYLDTHNVAAGVSYRLMPRHRLNAGVGYFPGNLGPADWIEYQRTSGIEFGKLDALNRYGISAGYRYAIGAAGYLQTGLGYTQGSASVPEGHPNQGQYDLQLITATTAGVVRF